MLYGSVATELRWAPPGPAVVRAYSHLAGPSRLARELGRPGGAGDGQLIAAALTRWGRDAPARFAGPFAFAVHEGDRLLLGRDQLGQFPLHYARIPGGIVLSVDVEAVLAHPQVDDEVDLGLAACQYARAYRPLLRRTPFRAVHKVPPGTLLTLTAGGVEEHRYWRPEELRVRERDPRDWAEELRQLLPVVVADAIPASGAIGAHASGGLDSTTVAVLADRALATGGRQLAAVYSWSPPPSGSLPPPAAGRVPDERWLVERVAAEHGWSPRYVPQGEELAAAQQTGDHPLTRPWQTWELEAWVARDAAARGIGVLLSGWGGDEFVSFNGRAGFRALMRRGHWLAAGRMVRRRGEILGHPAGIRAVAGKLAVSLLPDPVTALVRARRRPARTPAPHQAWAGYPLAARALREEAARVRAAARPHELQLVLLDHGHLSARCEGWSSAAARFGLSYRFPLLDPRLVTLALSAPAACFLAEGWDRYGFRLAAQHVLPAELAWNPTKVEPVLNERRLATAPSIPGAGRDLRLEDLERTALRVRTTRRAASGR